MGGNLFMTADAIGGVWTYALDLASELGRRGLRTTLAVLGPDPAAAQAEAADAIPNLSVVSTGLPLDWQAAGPGALAGASRRLAALARESAAELVHLNSPALAAGGAFDAPVVGVCHSCLATWWDAVRGGNLPEDFAWKTEQLASGYAACDALVAPSFAFMQATAARYGFVPRVVRNGRAAGPRRRQPDQKRPVVFASGRFWDEAKNLAGLDAAAARMRPGLVHAAGPLAHDHAAAPTPRAAVALGVLASPALSIWLNRAAVFASLALYEPFGLGVLEAAQAGCALVLSDIPTHRELWEGAAVFVDPSEPAAVAEMFDGLLADPAEAARLGVLAERRAQTFTVAAMAEGVLRVYRELGAFAPPAQEAAA